MTAKSESGVGGVGPETLKEKRCNKCKKSLSMDKFSLNRSTPDGFDRTCKECLKTIPADKKKNKKEKTIRAGSRRRNPVIDKKPKGNADYTYSIELPAQLIRAVSHSIAKRICEIIMEHFPDPMKANSKG